MIIDFTKNMTDEEYKDYWRVVESYWLVEDELFAFENYHDSEGEISEENYYEGKAEIEDQISDDTRQWINELLRDFNRIKGHFITERKWFDCTAYNVSKSYQWLQNENIQYLWLKNPHPREEDYLFFKNEKDWKLYQILFMPTKHDDYTKKFLTNDLGWIAIKISRDGYDYYKWLKENTTGYRYSYNMDQRLLYFQQEEDAVLFKMVMT